MWGCGGQPYPTKQRCEGVEIPTLTDSDVRVRKTAQSYLKVVMWGVVGDSPTPLIVVWGCREKPDQTWHWWESVNDNVTLPDNHVRVLRTILLYLKVKWGRREQPRSSWEWVEGGGDYSTSPNGEVRVRVTTALYLRVRWGCGGQPCCRWA